MSITPLRFTGVSTFSQDFQVILDRAVSIAQLPVQAMMHQQADLIGKKQTLGLLGSKIQALASAVGALGAHGQTKGLTATSSNTAKVSVAVAGTASSASYVISDITSVARRATESTLTGLATLDQTAVNESGNTVELVFGDNTYEIDLTSYGNNLNGLSNALRAKISQEGLGLSVALIHSGDPDSPHHLTLSATNSGATKLELWTEPGAQGTNLLTGVNQGANAVFKINGVEVVKPSNLISGVAPGLNLNIVDTTSPGETIVIDVSSSKAPVETALKNFVAAYNAVAADLNAQIGESAGLLSGDYLVGHAKGLLRQIAGYTNPGGPIRSLTDLGIELNSAGEMSFNTTNFYALSTDAFQDAFRFLGSDSTGFGSLTSGLDQLSHPFLTDLIDNQIKQYDASDARLQKQIAAVNERIGLMQATMFRQLQQADVLLARLEGQQRMLDASIEAVNYALYGKRDR